MFINSRNSPVTKIISVTTAVCVLGLATPTYSLAFDPEFSGVERSNSIYGLSLNIDFEFNNFELAGFTHQPVQNLKGSSTPQTNSFISIQEGVVKTRLPLVTLGDGVRYPGILYNHDGTQFYDHVTHAASGEEDSQSLVGLYILGIAAMGGVVFAMASGGSSSSDDKNPATDVEATEADTTIDTETISPDLVIDDSEIADPESGEEVGSETPEPQE